jgi:hypothetical protein
MFHVSMSDVWKPKRNLGKALLRTLIWKLDFSPGGRELQRRKIINPALKQSCNWPRLNFVFNFGYPIVGRNRRCRQQQPIASAILRSPERVSRQYQNSTKLLNS